MRSSRLAIYCTTIVLESHLLDSWPFRPGEEGLCNRDDVPVQLVVALTFGDAPDEDTVISSLVALRSGGDATAIQRTNKLPLMQYQCNIY